MIKIDRVFFCDGIAPGQFGKVNVVGLIPKNSIALDDLPYTLVTHLVIWGQSSETDVHLKVKLDFQDQTGKTLNTTTAELEPGQYVSKTVSGQPPFHLFLVVPSVLLIASYGSLDVSILTSDDHDLYKTSYELVKGAAPRSAVKDHIPQSAIFSGANNLDSQFVVDLIATANRTLKIFDAYLDPAALRTLLAKVEPQTEILVITGLKSKAALQADKSLPQQYPLLTVKGSPQLHDRFLVINDCEHFHFGHSLKDVVRGKLSRCSKIVNKEELSKLVTLLNSLEKQAVT